MSRITNKDIIIDPNQMLRTRIPDMDLTEAQDNLPMLTKMREYVIDSLDPDLAELHDLEPAVGIAAPQIGLLKRMCVVYIVDDEGDIMCDYQMINPKIIAHTTQLICLESGEGCLSIKDKYEGYVYRANKITVRFLDETLTEQTITVDGFISVAIQHEIDHLNGILYYDHINQVDPFEKKDNVVWI
ncbi:MAG: peptide deformylase [Mycoplasmatales bacterium]